MQKNLPGVGKIINGDKNITDIIDSCNYLINKLSQWSEILKIPKLSSFGLNAEVISDIIKRVGQKNNPVNLTFNELENILKLSI